MVIEIVLVNQERYSMMLFWENEYRSPLNFQEQLNVLSGSIKCDMVCLVRKRGTNEDIVKAANRVPVKGF